MKLKNVMIYWSYDEGDKFFSTNCLRRSSPSQYAVVQIDNALDLGWDVNDIIFATNFDWEHKGVKTTLLQNLNSRRGLVGTPSTEGAWRKTNLESRCCAILIYDLWLTGHTALLCCGAAGEPPATRTTP